MVGNLQVEKSMNVPKASVKQTVIQTVESLHSRCSPRCLNVLSECADIWCVPSECRVHMNTSRMAAPTFKRTGRNHSAAVCVGDKPACTCIIPPSPHVLAPEGCLRVYSRN